MSWWILEPRDPMMVRDGRPFGLDTEGARSLDFPPPSVIAGAMRTRVGFAAAGGDGRFGLSPKEAQQIEVTGPLLVEMRADAPADVLFLAPRDCVLFEGAGEGWPRYRLAPDEEWDGSGSSLLPRLRPVGGVSDLPVQKPAKDAPVFWTSAEIRDWLARPAANDTLRRDRTQPKLGHETRIHVAIDPATGTGEDGKLFQTDGLRLHRRDEGGWTKDEDRADKAGKREKAGNWVQKPAVRKRFAFGFRCGDARLKPGVLPIGGERRLATLEPASDLPGISGWSAPATGRRARIVLLTPAMFKEGAVPGDIRGAKVIAAVVGRPVVVSGWDMAFRNPNGRLGAPKPVRRLAPAGSVYWVELPEGTDAASWAASVHLQTISDDEQDRRDGFGLAAVGVWP